MIQTIQDSVFAMQLYYHHFAASYRFIGSSGPEYRGASAPFPAPYGRVVNGSMMANREWRQVNLEFVSQRAICILSGLTRSEHVTYCRWTAGCVSSPMMHRRLQLPRVSAIEEKHVIKCGLRVISANAIVLMSQCCIQLYMQLVSHLCVGTTHSIACHIFRDSFC